MRPHTGDRRPGPAWNAIIFAAVHHAAFLFSRSSAHALCMPLVATRSCTRMVLCDGQVHVEGYQVSSFKRF